MVDYTVKFSGSLKIMFGKEVIISVKNESTIEQLLNNLIKENTNFKKYVKYEGENIISPLILVDGNKVKKDYLVSPDQNIFIVRRSLGG